MLLLSLLYRIVWVRILQKENGFKKINEIAIYLNAGLFCALLQITFFDSEPFGLTGTWLSMIK